MQIVVDANEARSGLAERLSTTWDYVAVRRLQSGDVAIGPGVLIERKTSADFRASLDDGRLFRQARRLTNSTERPIFIVEGNADVASPESKAGACRGAVLALSVGFRIPVLQTDNLEETARLIRHMAAQESRRETRRRRRTRRMGPTRKSLRLSHDAIDVLRALPGIGKTRAESLAAHAPSLQAITQMTWRELIAVPGIGPDTAARILETIRGPGADGLTRRLDAGAYATSKT